MEKFAFPARHGYINLQSRVPFVFLPALASNAKRIDNVAYRGKGKKEKKNKCQNHTSVKADCCRQSDEKQKVIYSAKKKKSSIISSQLLNSSCFSSETERNKLKKNCDMKTRCEKSSLQLEPWALIHWGCLQVGKFQFLLLQKVKKKRAMGLCRGQAVVTVYRCRNSATLSESKIRIDKWKKGSVAIVSFENQSSSMVTSPWSTVEGGVGSVTGANGSVFSGNVSTSEVSVTGEPLSLVLWVTEVGGGASSPSRRRILSPMAFICASIARRPILSS